MLIYCIHLANRLNLDIDEIVLSKLEKTRAKYPVELNQGVISKTAAP